MKKIFFIVAISATAVVYNSFAQDSTTARPSQLLTSYYNIKNAMVAGNSGTASISATEFVKILNGFDSKIVDDVTRVALLKDAAQIAESKDIRHQREHFAGFSTNMYALAKAVKLTTDPVYYTYCPMKKAHWLSSESIIKNPYFGNAMLTCGTVEETLK